MRVRPTDVGVAEMSPRRKPPAKARKAREKLDSKARAVWEPPPERFPFRTRAKIWLVLIALVMFIAYLLG